VHLGRVHSSGVHIACRCDIVKRHCHFYSSIFVISRVKVMKTRKPPVEAALVVTYLEFSAQVCFPCIGQHATPTLVTVTDTFLNASRVFVVVVMFG